MFDHDDPPVSLPAGDEIHKTIAYIQAMIIDVEEDVAHVTIDDRVIDIAGRLIQDMGRDQAVEHMGNRLRDIAMDREGLAEDGVADPEEQTLILRRRSEIDFMLAAATFVALYELQQESESAYRCYMDGVVRNQRVIERLTREIQQRKP